MSEQKPIISQPVYDFVQGAIVSALLFGAGGGGSVEISLGSLVGGLIGGTLGVIAAIRKKRRER